MKYVLKQKNIFILFIRYVFSSQIFTDLLTNDSASNLHSDMVFDRNKEQNNSVLENNHCMFSFAKNNESNTSLRFQSTIEVCNSTFPEERYNPRVFTNNSCIFSDCTYDNISERPENSNYGNNQRHFRSTSHPNLFFDCEKRVNSAYYSAHDPNIASAEISRASENFTQTLNPTVSSQLNYGCIPIYETRHKSFENKFSQKYLDQRMMPYQKSNESDSTSYTCEPYVQNQKLTIPFTSEKKTDSQKRKRQIISLDPSNIKKKCDGLHSNSEPSNQLDSLSPVMLFMSDEILINNNSNEIKFPYYELAGETLSIFMDKKNKKYCENYEYFLSFIPGLFLEIETVSEEDFLFNQIHSNSILSHLSSDNWNKYIDDKIENYDFISIDSEVELKKISTFSEGLIFYEKNVPSHMKNSHLMPLYEKMTFILLKMKSEDSFGLFYELIKFETYYETNLYNYIEPNHNLYVYYILSIILKQLKHINSHVFSDSNIYNRKKILCRQPFNSIQKQEYNKKFFVQRLFSKLLLGMKNGILRSKFYNVALILDISSEKHRRKYYFNQTSYFIFFLRVFTSFVLEPNFNSNAESLDKFCRLSLDIINLSRSLGDRFLEKLAFMMENFNSGVFTVKTNIKLIRKFWGCDKDRIRLNDKLIYLYNKNNLLYGSPSIPHMYFSINDIFLSEICLSACLSRIYSGICFDEGVNCYGLKVILEKRLKL
ncbi:hypothetical protein CWI37_1142p0010 [Hamiltosporidium tvaerminnensis]|uniref:Uncharacterized protein n=1 Tax=Hamiltosporidium tvaerminnensis TaxID=1176355 RepID=A0A4V2JUI5_9MICR|nr:hypothetical protein LUQ84_001647 [Hamiltosporidium tvaerminnensis]TBU00012.1 hypothetical protein CWI37_1142p0010 [Hamiltosporidium tvaerminnensis]